MTTTTDPQTRRFTRAEFYKMAEAGLFDRQRVELLGGEIVALSPRNNPHAWAITAITRCLVSNLSPEFAVRCQLPLALNDTTEPEPDFAVVPSSAAGLGDHPSTALLVIEVADTTLRHDRRKAHLYARAGVNEYWIVHLTNRTVEVHRTPRPDPEAPFAARYAEQSTYAADAQVQAQSVPLPPLRVRNLLPRVGER